MMQIFDRRLGLLLESEEYSNGPKHVIRLAIRHTYLWTFFKRSTFENIVACRFTKTYIYVDITLTR